jgi:hypothetical protein
MSFLRNVCTFVEVVPRVPLHLARGFIHLSCGSTQACACGLSASWPFLQMKALVKKLSVHLLTKLTALLLYTSH